MYNNKLTNKTFIQTYLRSFLLYFIMIVHLFRWSAGGWWWHPETFPSGCHHESDPQETISLRQEVAGTLPLQNLKSDGDPWEWRVGGQREQRTESRWGWKSGLCYFRAAWDAWLLFISQHMKVCRFFPLIGGDFQVSVISGLIYFTLVKYNLNLALVVYDFHEKYIFWHVYFSVVEVMTTNESGAQMQKDTNRLREII